MEIHELLIIMASCIFSGIVAADIITKNRRKVYRNKMDSKTRKEMLDEYDQNEWDSLLSEKYSNIPLWYSV